MSIRSSSGALLKCWQTCLLVVAMMFAARLQAQVTYDPANFSFEAEDFNFNGGQFVDNPALCFDPYYTYPAASSDCYFNQIGYTNIDQFEINFKTTEDIPSGADSVFRFGDGFSLIRYEWVDTWITDDTLVRSQYTSAGVQDYEIRNIIPGEWLNYTRTFPAGNYNIYMRAASASSLSAKLYKVTGATTTSQSLTYAGRFATSAATSGYEFVPLTDDSGTNLITVGFPGSSAQTLRVSALSSGFTPNFYMFVASGESPNLPPTVKITDPTNATELIEGVPVTIQATATDPETSVTNVAFYAGFTEPLTLIGETNLGPYSMTWTPPSLGSIRTYTVRVVATDTAGLVGSDEITVTVSDPAIEFVSTAAGNGADAEMREQNDLGVSYGGSYRTISSRTYDSNNEIIALRFDLTGQDFARLADVKLNLVSSRDDGSTRQLTLYGVIPGTAGATAVYTTEDWDENNLTAFGDMPGLLAADGDTLTQSLNTEALVPLGGIVGKATKGEIKTFDSPDISTFLQTNAGNTQVTFLIANTPGYVSSGQSRFATKEAISLEGGYPTGEEGDFAPFLQFKALTNALPFITITNPTNAAELVEGTEVVLAADASDADGTITNVQFYAGTSEPLTLLGEDQSAPYTLPWTPAVLGGINLYTIQAVATDNTGQSSTNAITVTVRPSAIVTLSTAVGDGSDVEMVEQNSTAARNSTDLHTRFNANNRNEVVGLKFDLTGYTNSDLNNLSLNLTSYRTDGSTRVIDVYGVTQGASGGSGAFTTETWSDTTVSAWGDLPGLLTSDGDIATMSIDTDNLTLLVDDFTMTGLTEGEVRQASSPELTSFIQNYTGSHLVTLLIVAGNTSGGQFTFLSKEATSTQNQVLTGSAGDFAPYLAFSVGAAEPPAAPPLDYVNDGSNITFIWTGNFQLQVQTNSLASGMSTNWVDFPGASGLSVPINKTDGEVLFRLKWLGY